MIQTGSPDTIKFFDVFNQQNEKVVSKGYALIER